MDTTYDKIGKGYNQTRQADPYLADRLYSLLASGPTKKYLDIGCGTGNYTAALYHKGVPLMGVDPSDNMLSIAKTQSPDLSWTLGQSEHIPFPDQFFDGAVATLTLHHWTDLEAGMKEVYRVVNQGKWVIFTSFPAQMRNYWLNAYFPKMMEDSIKVMPSQNRVVAALTEAGWKNLHFEPYSIQPDLQDLFLYSGKHAPRRYLDAGFRQGISSFRLQANAAEIEKGLQQLETDILSGKWKDIMAEYDGQQGDYVFVVGEKTAP